MKTHIETRTLTAVASESFNNVFSADFTNYKIIFRLSPSTTLNVTLRYRASNSDDSNTNYTTQNLQGSSSTASASLVNNSANTMNITESLGTGTFISAEIFNPFSSGFTHSLFTTARGSGNLVTLRANTFTATTSFDGFSILASTGNFSTGTITIYGYKV